CGRRIDLRPSSCRLPILRSRVRRENYENFRTKVASNESRSGINKWRSRRDLNPDSSLRRAVCYPLHYGSDGKGRTLRSPESEVNLFSGAHFARVSCERIEGSFGQEP